MSLDRTHIARLLESARHRDPAVLLETEGMDLLEAVGIQVPRRIEFASPLDVPPWAPPPLPGGTVVLKALARELLHKTERRAVAAVPNRREAVVAEAEAMSRRLAPLRAERFVAYEFIPHRRSLGHELMVGLRWTDAFGPVVAIGAGGIHAEFLARAFPPGEGLAVLAADDEPGRVARALAALTPVRLVTESWRGRRAEIPLESLARVVRAFMLLAEEFCPDPIRDLEVNPLVVSGSRLVALDALGTLRAPLAPAAPPRPREKIRRLLEPRSIAVMGVSEKLNPGRIILRNILHAGFDPRAVFVVKPGLDSIDGCRCVPAIADLPQAVDLLVLSLAAAQAPEALEALVEGERAESVILIPGGLEEKPGGQAMVARMRACLDRSRLTPWKGPVVNGGNCLGIRSGPGRYNTLFIPEHKLQARPGPPDPLALVTGSGAFAASKSSKLARLNPRYTITFGNQMDLTLSDYLEYLERDEAVAVFAIYLEGFRPLDGRRFIRASRRIVESGRTVVLYAAGRTRAGAAAAASHTAAVAGDYEVTRQLARDAGAIVAETLEDFEDLVRLSVAFAGRRPSGLRLGAVSNAGYECVAVADYLGPLELARFDDATVAGLAGVIERARLGEIVSIRNPIDVTPVMADADFEAVASLVLGDPNVDVGLVACVPLTGALETLAAGEGHAEDVERETSVAARLVRLRGTTEKPWVAVVDSGPPYDRLAQVLEEGGIPTFRTADRALRLLGRICRHRLGPRGGASAPARKPGHTGRVRRPATKASRVGATSHGR